jgi:5,10-methylenetetrahydromethanopterin reductase
MFQELRDAEDMGLGTAFISERFNIKEAGALTGAAIGATSNINIVTAATNHTTRHPIVSASWASTLHLMSEGRFSLGLGRGSMHTECRLRPPTQWNSLRSSCVDSGRVKQF